jgi:starch synthase
MEHFRIWQVSREYAGIAEAGGVKNVTTSLCEELAKEGHDVSLFMPLYGCSCTNSLENYKKDFVGETSVCVCGKNHKIGFDVAYTHGVRIIFVKHPAFAEKNGVYTYTVEDEKKRPRAYSRNRFFRCTSFELDFSKSRACFRRNLRF